MIHLEQPPVSRENTSITTNSAGNVPYLLLFFYSRKKNNTCLIRSYKKQIGFRLFIFFFCVLLRNSLAQAWRREWARLWAKERGRWGNGETPAAAVMFTGWLLAGTRLFQFKTRVHKRRRSGKGGEGGTSQWKCNTEWHLIAHAKL